MISLSLGVVSVVLGLTIFLSWLTHERVLLSPQRLQMFNAFLVKVATPITFGVLLLSNFGYLRYFSPGSLEVSAAPEPGVALQAPEDVLLGSDFEVTVNFDNTSSASTGFGPFVDLLIPVNGADGVDGEGTDGSPTEVDGITTVNEVTYQGVNLTYFELPFPNDTKTTGVQNTGCVEHPLAVGVDGRAVEVCGNTGDVLVVAQLPFGSFVPEQPTAGVVFNLSLSEKADLGFGLDLQARGGFQFGEDEFSNPSSDPTILSPAFVTSTVQPQVVTFARRAIAPESEVVSGPNSEIRYELSLQVAEGQTVNNLGFEDTIDSDVVFKEVISSSPATCNVVPSSGTGPNNNTRAVIDCGTIAPPDSSVDIVYTVYVADFDADGNEVINHVTGDDSVTQNTAVATGEWEPIDARDRAPLDPNADNSFTTAPLSAQATAKSILVRKSVAIDQDTGATGYTPGDILRYTLDFQVSDYFAFDNVILTDVIGDGVHLVETSAPTLELTSSSGMASAGFDLANYNIFNNWTGATPTPTNPNGETTLTLDVAGELAMRRGNGDGRVFGGCIPRSGISVADCDTYNTGLTSGRITYLARILEEYTDIPQDESIDHADQVTNTVEIAGDVVNNALPTQLTGQNEIDSSQETITVLRGQLTKSLYAVNDQPPVPNTPLSPGDKVTYRLEYTLPSSDTEGFEIVDYLPKPVFDAATLGNTVNLTKATSEADSPPVGGMRLGPDDTFYAVTVAVAQSMNPVGQPIVPQVTTNTGANSVTFTWGEFDDPNNTPSRADVLLSVEVSDAPFADGLKLTNQAAGSESNTTGTTSSSTGLNQITLAEPEPVFTKGFIGSDNPATTLEGEGADPGFAAIGSNSCPVGSGVTSSFLQNNPLNSDVAGVNGSDIVRGALIIENNGAGAAYDLRLRDALPAGYTLVPGSVCVTRGDGTVLNTTDLGGGLMGQGLEIIDDTDGALLPNFSSTGENVILVTYELQAANDLDLTTAVSSQATVFAFASKEGGTNFGGSGTGGILFEEAMVTPLAELPVTKTPTTTTEPTTSNEEATPGADVTYEARITIPEGATPDVSFEDELDGLTLLQIDSLNLGSVISSHGTNTDILASHANVGSNGESFKIDFGNLTNTNAVEGDVEEIVLTYTARVLQTRTTPTDNTATVSWVGLEAGEFTAVDDTDNDIDVVSPELTVEKVIQDASPLDAGDEVDIDLEVTNEGDATAYEIELSDTLPAKMEFVSGFTALDGTAAPTTSQHDNGTVTITYPSLAAGETVKVRFRVEIADALIVGEELANTATTTYSSLPGDQTTAGNSNPLSREQEYTVSDTDRTQRLGNPSSTKNILSTSVNDQGAGNTPITTGNNVTVGEEIRYEYVVNLPEGNYPNARFVDLGFEEFRMVEIESIVASNGVTTDYAGGFARVVTDANDVNNSNGTGNVNGDGNETYTLNLGNVTNTDTANATLETLTITFRQRVDNSTRVQAGDQRRNRGRLVWNNDGGIRAQNNASQLTIVEPDLLTTLVPDVTEVDSAEIVTYTLKIINNGTSPAREVELTNFIPGEYTLDTNSLNFNGSDVTFSDTNAPDYLFTIPQINVNETVEISYTLTVNQSAIAADILESSVVTTYTSLPDNADGERTGDGTAPNTYRGEVTSQVNVRGVVPVVKTVVETSNPGSGNEVSGVTQTNLGEVVRYRLVVGVSESTLPDFRLVDELPAGLRFLDDGTVTVALVSNGGLTGSTLGAGAETNGNSSAVSPSFAFAGKIVNASDEGEPFASGDDVRFELGDLVNTDNDGDSEFVVLEFNVLVENEATNQSGTLLGSPFSASLENNGRVTLGTSQVVAANQIRITEPELTLTKTVTTVPVDAGDEVVYELRLANGDDVEIADAYNVVLTDVVSSDLTVQNVQISGVSGIAPTSTDPLEITFPTIAPNQVVIVTITATVNNGVASGQTIPNTANLVYNSLPTSVLAATNPTGSAGETSEVRTGADGVNGTLNDYAREATADFSLGTPTIVKTDAQNTTYAVGAELDYEIAVTLREGQTQDLVVIDELPTGLDYVGYEVLTDEDDSTLLSADYAGTLATPQISGGAGSGDNVSFDFGDTTTTEDNDTGNNVFVLRVRVQVVNEQIVQNGLELINTARINYQNPNNQQTVTATSATEPITVVEPELEVTLVASNDNPGYDETVTYTLTLRHTDNSSADAYDIDLDHLLDSGLDYDLTNLTFPNGWTNTLDEQLLSFVGDLPLGQSAEFVFQARTKAAGTYPISTTLTNTVNAIYTSQDGDVTGERDGSQNPVYNNYSLTQNDELTVSAPDLVLELNNQTNGVEAGATVNYSVEVENEGNTAADATELRFTVPENTQVDQANSSAWTCTPDNTAGSVCTAPLASLEPNESEDELDFALVVDSAIPAGVENLTLTVEVVAPSTGTGESAAANNVVTDTDTLSAAPDLTVTKTDSRISAVPGETLTYTIEVNNLGTQTAENVVIEDTLPAGLTFVAASNGGIFANGVVTFEIPSLAVGVVESPTILTVEVAIPNPAPSELAELTNVVIVRDDGENGGDLDSDDNRTEDVTTVVAAPNLALTKSITSPATITPGATVVYQLAYTNTGSQTATEVELEEVIPAGTTFLENDSRNADWTCIANRCARDVGIVEVNQGGQVEFVVQVDPTIDFDQETLFNSALVRDDENNGEDEDSDDNSTDLTTALIATPDIRTTITDNLTELTASQTVSYLVEVFNDGLQDTETAFLNVDLPAGLTLTGVSTGGSQNGTRASWENIALEANESRIYVVTARVDNPLAITLDSASVTATASFVSATDTDPTANNIATDTDTLIAAPELEIIKSDRGITLEPGMDLVYDLDYRNVGTQGASGVTLVEEVPEYTTFNPTLSDSGWNCIDERCSLVVGTVPGGQTTYQTAVFAVTVDETLPAEIETVQNTVLIRDDGTNGTEVSQATVSETTTTFAQPDLRVTLADEGQTKLPGETIAYTATYANIGNQNATGVTLRYTIPTGATMDLNTPENANWICNGTTAGSICTYVLGAVAAGADDTVSFLLTIDEQLPAALDGITHEIEVFDDGQNGAELETDNNEFTVFTPVTALPELEITKTDADREQVAFGDEFTYTLTIRNTGDQDATGVVVEDVLPDELDLVNASDGGTYDANTRTVTFPDFVLAVDQEVTRIVEVRFNISDEIPVGLEEITNVATVRDDNTNGGLATGRSEDTNAVVGDPNLEIELEVKDGELETGETVIYTLTTRNSGNQATDGVELTMVIPEGMRVDFANSSAGWVCTPDNESGATCRLLLGEVDTAVEIETDLALVVDQISAVDEVEVAFNVRDDGRSGSEDEAGNQVQDSKSITGNPDLQVTKSDGQTTTIPGEILEYEIEVTNNGDIMLTGITLTDTLPAYVDFVAASDDGVWNEAAREVVWTNARLLPGQSIQYTLRGQVVAALPELVEEITNVVSVGDDETHGTETEAARADNEAVDTNRVVAEPDLSVEVTTPTTLAYPGEEVDYEVRYTNTGDQDATGVTVTFEIPKYTRGLATQEPTTLAPQDFNLGWDCPSLEAATVCSRVIGNLAVDETGTVPFTVVVDEEVNANEPVLITNVTIFDDGANGEEIRFDNNVSAVQIPIPFANLVVEKTTGQSEYLFGERILYVIDYENQGPDAATEVTIVDLLPAELNYVSSLVNGAGFDPEAVDVDGRSELTFRLGEVPVGERGQIIIATEPRTNLNREIRNEIRVASREAEISASDNLAVAEITQAVVPTLDEVGQPLLLRTGLRMSPVSLAYLLFLAAWIVVSEYLALRGSRD